jgi:hypothetical protein
MTEGLVETIKIAQSHINGENTSLEDVINAFNKFAEQNTPITEKSWCKYEIPFAYALAAANDLNVLVSDEELAKFIDDFDPSNLFEEIIEVAFWERLKYSFKDSPAGNMFASAIERNNIERVQLFLNFMANNRGGFSLFINNPTYDRDDKKLIEVAAAKKRKEIIQILLQYDVFVDSKIIKNTTDSEMKKILQNAWEQQSKEAFEAIEAGNLEGIRKINSNWEEGDLYADILSEAKPYNNESKTLYEYAIEKGQTEIADFLTQKIEYYKKSNLH